MKVIISYLSSAIFILCMLTFPSSAAEDSIRQKEITAIAVQMQVRLEDYRSEKAFRDRIDYYMVKSMRYARNGSSIIAFPEDVGLGLIFLDNYDLVENSDTFQQAAQIIAQNYAAEMGEVIGKYPGISFARALLLVRGETVRRVYYDTFSQAAKKYGVTIVAGSAPVPGGDGAVYNASFVFGPDGKQLGKQNKIHLTPMEDNSQDGLDLTPGTINSVRPIDTPVGRIGIAICYDAFFNDVVDSLVRQDSILLVQPSFNPKPWTPEQAAEWKTGIWTAVKEHPSIAAGINPMMVGSLWQVRCEGMSSIAGGPYDPPADGYLAKSAVHDKEDIVVAVVSVPD